MPQKKFRFLNVDMLAFIDAKVEELLGSTAASNSKTQYKNTIKKLFDEFVDVIARIPKMILVEIYDVPGREESAPVSARDLIAAVKARTGSETAFFASDLEEAERMIRDHVENFDVILVIGAGDADTLAKRLVGHTSSS